MTDSQKAYINKEYEWFRRCNDQEIIHTLQKNGKTPLPKAYFSHCFPFVNGLRVLEGQKAYANRKYECFRRYNDQETIRTFQKNGKKAPQEAYFLHCFPFVNGLRVLEGQKAYTNRKYECFRRYNDQEIIHTLQKSGKNSLEKSYQSTKL